MSYVYVASTHDNSIILGFRDEAQNDTYFTISCENEQFSIEDRYNEELTLNWSATLFSAKTISSVSIQFMNDMKKSHIKCKFPILLAYYVCLLYDTTTNHAVDSDKFAQFIDTEVLKFRKKNIVKEIKRKINEMENRSNALKRVVNAAVENTAVRESNHYLYIGVLEKKEYLKIIVGIENSTVKCFTISCQDSKFVIQETDGDCKESFYWTAKLSVNNMFSQSVLTFLRASVPNEIICIHPLLLAYFIMLCYDTGSSPTWDVFREQHINQLFTPDLEWEGEELQTQKEPLDLLQERLKTSIVDVVNRNNGNIVDKQFTSIPQAINGVVETVDNIISQRVPSAGGSIDTNVYNLTLIRNAIVSAGGKLGTGVQNLTLHQRGIAGFGALALIGAGTAAAIHSSRQPGLVPIGDSRHESGAASSRKTVCDWISLENTPRLQKFLHNYTMLTPKEMCAPQKPLHLTLWCKHNNKWRMFTRLHIDKNGTSICRWIVIKYLNLDNLTYNRIIQSGHICVYAHNAKYAWYAVILKLPVKKTT